MLQNSDSADDVCLTNQMEDKLNGLVFKSTNVELKINTDKIKSMHITK